MEDNCPNQKRIFDAQVNRINFISFLTEKEEDHRVQKVSFFLIKRGKYNDEYLSE